ERDLAERIHVRGPHPGPRVPEARPPVLAVPALVDHAPVRELDADLHGQTHAAQAPHDYLGVEGTHVTPASLLARGRDQHRPSVRHAPWPDIWKGRTVPDLDRVVAFLGGEPRLVEEPAVVL